MQVEGADDTLILHEKAMASADEADRLRRRGDEEGSVRMFREAAASEEAAAAFFANLQPPPEPTRSILLRSAASLALEGNDLVAAERLLRLGLAGIVPPEIADELHELRAVLEGRLAGLLLEVRSIERAAAA